MTHWDHEQEQYRLSKRDSEEMAAICFAGAILMVLFGLALELWQRFVAPAWHWIVA